MMDRWGENARGSDKLITLPSDVLVFVPLHWRRKALAPPQNPYQIFGPEPSAADADAQKKFPGAKISVSRLALEQRQHVATSVSTWLARGI